MALKVTSRLAAATLVATLACSAAIGRPVESSSLAPAPSSGFAKVQGEGFWYSDTGGAGVPVVLLHAGTGTSDYWADEVARLRDAGFRVIVYDRRGWGKTTALPKKAGGASAAQDLNGIADYLKLSRFHLIAIASGGRVALDYASEHSKRLLSLIVIGSVGPAFRNEGEPELSAYYSRIAIPGLSPAARELSSTYRGDNPEGVKRWQVIQDGAKNPDAFDIMGSPQTYQQIAKITASTLVIAGGADLLVPPGYEILWAAHIPNSSWVVVPSAAHSLPWEQPTVFSDIIIRFMRGDRSFKRSNACVNMEDLAGACRIPKAPHI